MHHELTRTYIELQALMLTPIAPHWSEYIWRDVLGQADSIQNATFPSISAQDPALTAARDYVRNVSSDITSAEGAQQKKLAKGKNISFDPKKDKKITIFLSRNYPAWQDRCMELVQEAFDGMTLDIKAISSKLEKAQQKKAMPFVQMLKRRLEGGEDKAVVFERKLPFDESRVLGEMLSGVKQTVPKCRVVEVVSVGEGGKGAKVVDGTEGVNKGEDRNDLPQVAEGAMPGSPTFHFTNL